eukprot:670015-Prymnesium_polylepis.1
MARRTIKSAVSKERLPLSPGQQGTMLTYALRILNFRKKPPAIRHAKRNLTESRDLHQLIRDKETAWTE